MNGLDIDPNLKIIGITGGSGSGKSFISHFFKRDGIVIISADEVARFVVRKGMPCLDEITESFGREILNEDGTLNRKKLGKIVFQDASRLKLLNTITHKYIEQEIIHRIGKLENTIGVVIDAAVLLESELKKYTGIIIAVIAERELRISRLVTRDDISAEEAAMRIDAQHPNSYYADKADFVIYNNGDLNELELETNMVFNIIFGDPE